MGCGKVDNSDSSEYGSNEKRGLQNWHNDGSDCGLTVYDVIVPDNIGIQHDDDYNEHDSFEYGFSHSSGVSKEADNSIQQNFSPPAQL